MNIYEHIYIYIYIYIYIHTYIYIYICGSRDPRAAKKKHAVDAVRSRQRDPTLQDDSLIRKETSTYKGFHSTFAALFSY